MIEALAGHFSGGLPIDELPPDVLDSLGRELAASRLLRAELVAFWNLLESVTAQVGIDCGDEVRLLNLACGPCVEAAVLSAFFGRPAKPGASRRKVRFFGMDLRAREIENARRRYAATEQIFRNAGVPTVSESFPDGDTGCQVEFFADDATRLVGYREIPRSFDIIFIRHQNVWNGLPVWRRIFQFALDRLADSSGRLIITSYFDREHLIALDTLKELGGRIIVSQANPDSLPLDHPGKSADRHMAVIERNRGEG